MRSGKGIVARLRSQGLALPISQFEGAGQLPRALFAAEVLARRGRVVASARAEREGEDLTLDDLGTFGESVQATVDRRGVCEALLRNVDRVPALVCRRGGGFEVWVADGDGERASALAAGLAADIRIEREASDPRIAVAFWSGAGDGFLSGPEPRWRLLILEDAGELLGVAAPSEVGRGFARLLNIADGLLGQGTRALILVTTNEPLGRLHPAALRPGRAMAALEFAPMRVAEANAWLAAHGSERQVDSSATIAELHSLLAGEAAAKVALPRGRSQVGFG